MKTYISILRGINVSGQKMIKMDELRALFESLHFENVTTYIQSGNVVFEEKATDRNELAKHIEKKILQKFGFAVSVLVIEKNELQNVLKKNPFVNTRKEESATLHVTFLSEEPDPARIDSIKKIQSAPDEYIFSGNVVYVFCPNGYGRTKLTNNFFENKLKIVATTRNWKTVNELMNIAENISVK